MKPSEIASLKYGEKVRITSTSTIKPPSSFVATVKSNGGIYSVQTADGHEYVDAEAYQAGPYYRSAYGMTLYNIERYKENEMSNTEYDEVKVTRYQDLRTGDRVRITREFTVNSSFSHDGGIRSNDNRCYRIAGADYSLPGFEVIKLVPKVQTPKHWPPQENDVWKLNGFTYHVQKYGTRLYAYKNGGANSIDELKNEKAELVYREGNVLR